jgi:stearoyl-CoA desaturase (delta-9 desaturase)
MYIAACITVFVVAYLVNMTAITVFYHRGLAHQAVELSPRTRRFAVVWGNWMTGLDPKGWVCMHRLHHAHSDTKKDPHSPVHNGIFPLLYKQLASYKRILVGLARNERKYCDLVKDLDFDISWLNRKNLWWLPYLTHATIALTLGIVMGWWLLGAAYFVGIMGHPIQGWAVNAFGHAYGGRNFDTDDDSRNNHIVAWLVMGEGFQNNHHQYPSSAKFSYRWYELDFGWPLCRVLQLFGLIKIRNEKLIPKPSQIRDRKPAIPEARASASAS